MKKTFNPWCLAVAFLLVLAPVAMAQEEENILDDAEVLQEAEKVDVSRIDQILRGDREVRQGEFAGYDPTGRRDPFRSLLLGLEAEDDEAARVRPPGLPGMMVEELVLEGIIEAPTGILAFVLGRDNISYIIRPGTALFNGEVKEIQLDRVIFRQQVNDPKQVRPYEEVVRKLSD